jgi:hypothetical protein
MSDARGKRGGPTGRAEQIKAEQNRFDREALDKERKLFRELDKGITREAEDDLKVIRDTFKYSGPVASLFLCKTVPISSFFPLVILHCLPHAMRNYRLILFQASDRS